MELFLPILRQEVPIFHIQVKTERQEHHFVTSAQCNLCTAS